MPVSPLGGWTAASLVPGVSSPAPNDPGLATRQVAAVPTPGINPQLTASLANPLIQNMLAAIYGPNYQSMLSTAPYQAPQRPDPNQNPALIEANAYAKNLDAKNAAMHAYQSYQGQLAKATRDAATMRSNSFGGYYDANYNAAQMNAANLSNQGDASLKVSQAAALSPSYAPTIFQSVGQNNTGTTWNPYGLSGWVSPVSSGIPRGTPNIANNILGMGV